VSVEDESWDRPICKQCSQIIKYGEKSFHLSNQCKIKFYKTKQMKTYNKENIWELLEDPDTIEIKELSAKHNCHYEYYVSKIDEKYYMYRLQFSYNDGLQLYGDVKLEEVKPVEKVIIDWVKV